MKQQITHSDKETKQFAQKLAKGGKYKIIGLVGDLGAGKTTFVQGFAKGLEIKDKIISPTFVLIRQHKIPDSKNMLFHIDLYRLENIADVKQIGIEEIIWDPNNVVLIEWAEKMKNKLPKEALIIKFRKIDGDKRELEIED